MNKIVLLFVILFGCSVSLCFADTILGYSENRPEWKEFCPTGFENSIYRDVEWFWPQSMKDTQNIYNYWSDRKFKFIDAVTNCDILSEEAQSGCYSDLRKKQKAETEQRILDERKKKVSQPVLRDINYKMTSPIMIDILRK